jgi:hypothetical protein
MRAAHMINEWWAVNIRQQLRQTEDCTTNIQRQQPRYGWWKCNVDAKFHDESGRMGCEIPYLRVSFTYELQKGCIRRLSHRNSIIETSYIKVTDIIGVKLHKT